MIKCIIIEDDEASKNVLTKLVKQVGDLELVAVFSNPVEALPMVKKGDIDLVFLDIEMPEMSGIDLLKSIEMPTTILTTTHKEYALDAFDHNIIDYLVKPITMPRFIKALEKAKHNLAKNNSSVIADPNYFFIKKKSVHNKVSWKSILWIEALGDYLAVNTFEEKYVVHLTLKAIENKLPQGKFVRVHRSFIVNMDNVGLVEDTTIYINNNPIPVGALYKDSFNKAMNLL
jgi:DNA-binding LytR/AlgR family response regulator